MADPVRTCLGCRQRAAQGALLRVVADRRTVRVDAARVLPGRGAYVHPVTRCVDQAVKRRAFGRALRAEVDTADAGRVLTAHLAARDVAPADVVPVVPLA